MKTIEDFYEAAFYLPNSADSNPLHLFENTASAVPAMMIEATQDDALYGWVMRNARSHDEITLTVNGQTIKVLP